MEFGKCRLCGVEGELQDGHISPRFGYKRYITGQGGRYFDSGKDKFETKQRTEYMFCHKCETIRTGSLDSWGAKFLAGFETEPYLHHVYNDEQFLRWTVSLSLRALISEDLHHPERLTAAHEAMEQWKDYLLRLKPSVAPFTQHAFLRYFEEDSHFQKLLDWDYFPEEGLTFFQMGPLVTFGLTRRANWSRVDKDAADASMVKRDGGYIRRLGEDYEAGVNIPSVMKEVSDEKNIRLLELWESSQRRAQDYLKAPEITRIEVRARIQAHRTRHPK